MNHQKILALALTLLIACGACGAAAASKTLTLPAALGSIEAESFRGDSSLSNVVVPDGIVSIGANAFTDCGALTITLPSTVTSIASSAFGGSTVPTIIADVDSYAYQWAESKGYTVRVLSYTEVKNRVGTNLAVASSAFNISIEEDYVDGDWTNLMECGGTNGELFLYSSWNSSCTAVEEIGIVRVDNPKYSLFGANTTMTYSQARSTLVSALSGWQANANTGCMEYVSSDWTQHVYLYYTGTAVDAIVYQLDVEPGTLLFTIPNQGIAFSASSVSMSLSDYDYAAVTANLTRIPFNSNPEITWRSSNTSVATVTSDGWVYPVAVGTTVITATTTGGYVAQCRVVVTSN